MSTVSSLCHLYGTEKPPAPLFLHQRAETLSSLCQPWQWGQPSGKQPEERRQHPNPCWCLSDGASSRGQRVGSPSGGGWEKRGDTAEAGEVTMDNGTSATHCSWLNISKCWHWWRNACISGQSLQHLHAQWQGWGDLRSSSLWSSSLSPSLSAVPVSREALPGDLGDFSIGGSRACPS